MPRWIGGANPADFGAARVVRLAKASNRRTELMASPVNAVGSGPDGVGFDIRDREGRSVTVYLDWAAAERIAAMVAERRDAPPVGGEVV